jgi:hypothetical protein
VGGGIYLSVNFLDFTSSSSDSQFSFGPFVSFDDSYAKYGWDIFVNGISGTTEQERSIFISKSFIDYDKSLMTRNSRYLLSGYENNDVYPIPLLRYLMSDECLLYLIDGWEEECMSRTNCVIKDNDCYLKCEGRYNQNV